MYARTRFSGWVAVVALAAVACGPSEEEKAQLAELPIVTAEKDRLQAEVDQLNTGMGEIASELTRLREAGTPASEETVGPPAPAEVRTRVGELVTHVSEMEEKLAATESRLRSVNATTAEQKKQITELEAAIAQERAAIQNHMQTITSLETAVANLEQETARLNTARQELEATVETMTDEANTVWYVVGTKEELIERGIIHEEGGSRVLFIFGKRGKTLVPSRDLDPTLFMVGDRRTLNEIVLPVEETDGEVKWAVVTAQDLGGIETPVDEKGRVIGTVLRIADPERFWSNSHYLIIVRT
ncbi:MAG: hypothetical protein L0271_20175 [Gemmatimonadetes bacterium]|nr:hypothetical protein [Gemmatimonadota bacterium]